MPSGSTSLETSSDLDELMERIGDARVVCIGEASHGTHEYYEWRAHLTRRLVEERDFAFVAVEGDWPDCHAVGRSVTASPDAPEDPRDALAAVDRWPTWMWANDDVVAFTRWLRDVNLGRPPERRVGFYGLDVYSLWESLGELVGYLREQQPEHVEAALEACRCLEPYAENPQAYARATRLVPTSCEPEVVSLLRNVLEDRATAGRGPDGDAEDAFAAEQNAHAVVSAEAYYRAMVRGGPESWNLRDIHMADTLDRLVRHHERRGDERVKAVVWEHNTHVGDARFTDMSDAGMVNVGQLVRQRYGERDTVLVGFASHHGSVVAARAWGDEAQEMRVPDARRGSLESVLHESLDVESALFVFANKREDWAVQERGHRAIGVVYRPEQEGWGNYVPTMLAGRYDALLWFDETTALRPLRPLQPGDGELEAWPFGA
ncbi:MAG: erythromycin esterase family protein [Actinomycetota bacterium]|nr:erythromycin esterase family protein [Actinomycetota bacterium]